VGPFASPKAESRYATKTCEINTPSTHEAKNKTFDGTKTFTLHSMPILQRCGKTLPLPPASHILSEGYLFTEGSIPNAAPFVTASELLLQGESREGTIIHVTTETRRTRKVVPSSSFLFGAPNDTPVSDLHLLCNVSHRSSVGILFPQVLEGRP
jgi:hypothetical protein